jgi:hypothetical protein
LATDEIKKLHGYKYYLQVDGFSAYWSIPVCEESKRLPAFHTPDRIHCCNRLVMMGATPSSAVQQTAYLEALDQYIDYDENDNLRRCLVDENGVQLRDAEGNLKEGTAPKAVNVCAFAKMKEPKDMHQLRAFLGCCQQLNQYIKDYGIIAKPLHNNITKKEAIKGPPPWIKGTDYDLAFIKLKAIISDSKLYLHHKDKLNETLIP